MSRDDLMQGDARHLEHPVTRVRKRGRSAAHALAGSA